MANTKTRLIRYGTALGLAAALARVWDLLLLKRTVEDPARLLLWIAAAWAAGGLVWLASRRAAPSASARRGMRFDVVVVLILLSVLLPVFDQGYQRAASDGRAYFVQLHSIFFEGNLDFADDLASFGGPPGGEDFPIGTALLWSPFYLAAHLWLGLLSVLGEETVRDGFSNPYQRAVGLATMLYGMAAVWIILAVVGRRFDRGTTLAAVLSIVLATPVVWYVAIDASMSHGVSLFAVTIFLALWLTARGDLSRASWPGLAVAALVMTLVRPQNVLFLSVLAIDAAGELGSAWFRDERARVRRFLRVGVVLVLLGMVTLVAVLAVGFIDADYLTRQGVADRWAVGLQLFSPHHGLLSSSPVLVFACVGLLLLLRTDPRLAIALGVAVGLQVLAGGTSVGWNAGASFGARRFVSSALPFALGLAVLVRQARSRPMVPVAVLLGGLVVMNLSLADDARVRALNLSEPVPFERMVRAVTARIGNPFALPGAFLFASRHRIPVAMYDRIPGRKYSTLRVDVGAPGDELYLFGEWFDREVAPDGAFRWASSPEAGIFTQVRGERYRLRFEAQPFSWPDAREAQRLEVYLGDTRLAELVMDPAMRGYDVTIPPERMPPDDWMRISFRFGYAVAPREVVESGDVRSLAARFRSIVLEPY